MPLKKGNATTQGLNLGMQASLRIAISNLNLLIYVDPFKIKKSEQANLIFITHPHFDHFDLESIKKLYSKGCIVCVPKGAEEIAKVAAKEDIKLVKPGMEFDAKGISVKTIPAYNAVANRQHYHLKQNEWVGYILQAGGQTIYHAGDTDRIPEMKSINGLVNTAFLPVGGTYTMDAKEAAEAVADINPDIACPMHVIPAGDSTAQSAAQQTFKQLVETNSKGKTKVEIINGKGSFE